MILVNLLIGMAILLYAGGLVCRKKTNSLPIAVIVIGIYFLIAAIGSGR